MQLFQSLEGSTFKNVVFNHNVVYVQGIQLHLLQNSPADQSTRWSPVHSRCGHLQTFLSLTKSARDIAPSQFIPTYV